MSIDIYMFKSHSQETPCQEIMFFQVCLFMTGVIEIGLLEDLRAKKKNKFCKVYSIQASDSEIREKGQLHMSYNWTYDSDI